MFENHRMPRLFARSRTPNDGLFVESLFDNAKNALAYPCRFLDREEAVDQFNWLFSWFNTEHLHSGSDYVTPEQCHGGLWKKLPLKEMPNFNNSVC
jgi:putative transposase